MSAVGAVLFVTLALVRLRQALASLDLLALLLAIQASLAAFRLVFRRPPAAASPWLFQVPAWASACLPLALKTSPTGWYALAAVPGLLLNLWSLAALGDSFSIAPADRGLVVSGPYLLVRHPMYAGELLSLFPALLAETSLRNALLFTLFLASILWRIRREEHLLSGYAAYTQTVRWRLLPGLW